MRAQSRDRRRGGRTKRRWVVPTVLGILAVAATGSGMAQQPPGAGDPREQLTLPAPARDMVLAEMRQMLRSMAGVLTGLAEGDTTAAATGARESGMAAAVDVAPEVAVLLPNAFIQLGMSTHQGFDALADKLEAGAPQQEVLAALAGLTENCVACHATYRIDEAP